MFDVQFNEILVLGAVALMVIPPKDLPKAMRVAGYWVGRARGVARQFRSGFDSMVRDAELQEMEKRWAEENARIMREHPPTPAQLMSPAPGDIIDETPPPAMTEMPAVGPAPVEPAEPVGPPPKAAVRRRKPAPEASPEPGTDKVEP